MFKNIQWIFVAFLTVLGIFVYSNLLKPSASWDFWVNGNVQTSVLSTPSDAAVDTAEEVVLSVAVPRQSAILSYGTQAEIFEFDLEAREPYSLRYLTFELKSAGLLPAREFTLFESEGGRIDFTEPVGRSETISVVDGGESEPTTLVRMRLFSSRSAAYQGATGKRRFVLVGSVLRGDAGNSGTALLAVRLPAELPDGFHWAWLPGAHSEAWLNVKESLNETEVSGLSTVWRERR